MTNKILPTIAICLLAGCGHVSNVILDDNTLLDKAEFATGIDRQNLTIVERSGALDSVEFTVKSNKGEKFRCYFTSLVAMNSDAVCQQIGGKKGNARKARDAVKSDEKCNALLKAAGRC